MRLFVGTAAALLAACISVPPEVEPPVNPRKATVIVDHNGQQVEGGNLIIAIPAGAVREGEKIQVTIDEIQGAPARHLSKAYLVGPPNYRFELPVTVTYRYTPRTVEDAQDLSALFVGVAQGQSWLPLDDHSHDIDAYRVAGTVTHFSVFGLVDPGAAADGGLVDIGGRDAGGSDLSSRDLVPRHDAWTPDVGSDGGVPSTTVAVQLTWDSPNADLDVHLLRAGAAPFDNMDDCYYANCGQGSSLDWPPAGTAGNPVIVVDDVSGYGPEYLMLDNPSDGTFVAAAHAFDLHGDPVPITFTLEVFHSGNSVMTVERQLQLCNEFHQVIDIEVSGGGTTVATTERSDEPTIDTHGSCQ